MGLEGGMNVGEVGRALRLNMINIHYTMKLQKN